MVSSYVVSTFWGMLGNGWTGGSWDTILNGLSLDACPRPADLVFWAEGPRWDGAGWYSTTAWVSTLRGAGAMSRHRNGANYAFADGHAQWLSETQMNIGDESHDTVSHWHGWKP